MPQRIRVELAAPLKPVAEHGHRHTSLHDSLELGGIRNRFRKSLRHEVAAWTFDSVRTAIAQDVS